MSTPATSTPEPRWDYVYDARLGSTDYNLRIARVVVDGKQFFHTEMLGAAPGFGSQDDTLFGALAILLNDVTNHFGVEPPPWLLPFVNTHPASALTQVVRGLNQLTEPQQRTET